MQAYRQIWVAVTTVLVGLAVSVLVSAAIIRQPVVAGVLLAVGASAFVVARRRPRVVLPVELRVVLGLVTTVAAIAGLSPLLGDTVMLVVLADLAAGIPLVVAGSTTGPGRGPRRAPPPRTAADEPEPDPTTDLLSTEDLCQAWCESGRVLGLSALSAEHRSRIVMARSRYLDELMRRYPDEMARWLAAGQPEADPAEFVNLPPRR